MEKFSPKSNSDLGTLPYFFLHHLKLNIMAQSKQHLYPTEDQITSSFAKALSHPARIQILKQLQIAGAICVQVIAQTHPISIEALSGHLKALREAHLVNWVERFPFTFYSVNEINVKKAFDYLESFFTMFKKNE